jgi:hypothetical protein
MALTYFFKKLYTKFKNKNYFKPAYNLGLDTLYRSAYFNYWLTYIYI